MHPSLVFALWLSVLIPLQACPFPVLLAVFGAAILLAGQGVRNSFFRLLRRSRWLLATLALTFVLLTPGEYPLPGLPVTEEGLRQAADHLLRLLAVLLAVAWLVGGRSSEWLLSALAGYAPPSSENGRRFVVRLGLTLRYAAIGEPRPSWRSLVDAANTDATNTQESSVLELNVAPWSLGGKLIAALALLGGLAAFGGLR